MAKLKLRLHGNMHPGVTLPPARADDAAGLWRADAALLRRLGVRTCLIPAPWGALEPGRNRFDEAAMAALHEQILLLRAMDVEPLLCFYQGDEPGWFRDAGGWEREDNIRHYLRYVEAVLQDLGHLVAEYVTFSEPNALCAARHSFSGARAAHTLSVIACAHIRAYTLIHDYRRGKGLKETAVGFGLHMRIFVPAGKWHVGFARTVDSDAVYQLLPLRAMANGEFVRPYKNLTGVQPGSYCDFMGLSYRPRRNLLPAGRAKRDDLGREVWPEGIGQCCGEMLKIAAKPIYVFDQGACDWDDSFRALYIYDHLQVICQSHQPVLRYYYNGLLDGREQAEGIAARRGLFLRDAVTGEAVMKTSGEFYAALIRDGGVTDESYALYVDGQEYRR